MPITMTAKRQATFPKALCEELGLSPGDVIDLERATVGKRVVWVFRPRSVDWSFIGSAPPRRKVSHDLAAIRASIARGRTGSR